MGAAAVGNNRAMSDFDHLESVLPGFSEAREIIKAAGDSIFPVQYRGTKFDFYRF